MTNYLARDFWGFVSDSTPPDDLGKAVLETTDEMIVHMRSNGYRPIGVVRVQEVTRGVLLAFQGEPMGWSN